MTDILIVEDEPAICEPLEFILRRCNWSVALACDGEAALEAAYRLRPCLMLLDIMIPKRNGLDVLRQIRGDVTLCAMPVLMLTASGRQYDRRAAEDLKADGFIAKPFANSEVVATVRCLLGPAASMPAGNVRQGPAAGGRRSGAGTTCMPDRPRPEVG